MTAPVTVIGPPLTARWPVLFTALAMVIPPVPVARINPALVMVFEPVSMANTLVPLATMMPAAWLTRVSLPAPRRPPPAISLALVSVADGAAPMIWLTAVSARSRTPVPVSDAPAAATVRLAPPLVAITPVSVIAPERVTAPPAT